MVNSVEGNYRLLTIAPPRPLDDPRPFLEALVPGEYEYLRESAESLDHPGSDAYGAPIK